MTKALVWFYLSFNILQFFPDKIIHMKATENSPSKTEASGGTVNQAESPIAFEMN